MPVSKLMVRTLMMLFYSHLTLQSRTKIRLSAITAKHFCKKNVASTMKNGEKVAVAHSALLFQYF